MAVDAGQDEAAAIGADLAVDDLDAPEADAGAHGLACRLDGETVEAGLLGAPGLDGGQVEAGCAGTVEDGACVELGEADGDGEGDRGSVDVDFEDAGAGGRVVVGAGEEVVDAAGGAVQEGDVAEDAGQPPLVLVLDVGARRPLRDADRERVLAGAENAGEVELGGEAGALGGADPGVVDPHGGEGLDAVEAQDVEGALLADAPVLGDLDGADVVGRRVGVGDEGRVERDGELDVGVDRQAALAVAGEDPGGW